MFDLDLVAIKTEPVWLYLD